MMKLLMRLHRLHPVSKEGEGATVLINPLHIVAVVPDGTHAEILTTPGVVYQVHESVLEVEAEALALIAQMQD